MTTRTSSTKTFNKKLLALEAVIGVTSFVTFFAIILLAALVDLPPDIRAWTIILSTIFFVTMSLVMLRMEQLIGHYMCKKCHHKYTPKYRALLWGMHFGRTHYLKCPRCQERSWQKKII